MSGQAAYDIVNIPLTTATQGGGTRIAKVGNSQVSNVALINFPAGAQISLKFGAGGAEIPITDKWSGIDFCPSHDQGIYFVIPTAQAGEVVLFIGYEQ